jgi:hypothetical protein
MATYCSFVALQFTIYEKTMGYFRRTMTAKEFHDSEIKVNCLAGFLGGSIGALLTNALESITVAKQTNPSLCIA